MAGSPWIGTAAPDLGDPQLREIHRLTHHSWKNEPNVCWVSDPPPENFQLLGVIEPSPADKPRQCSGFGGWVFGGQVYWQWRWDHEREAVLREDQEYAEKQAREYQEAEKNHRAKLGGLTLEGQVKKRRFQHWTGDCPSAALAACRTHFRESAQALLALQDKTKKRDVLKILKRCIQSLNRLDEEHDHFIETTKREDLCDEFDELVHAAGLRGYDNLADRWRDW